MAYSPNRNKCHPPTLALPSPFTNQHTKTSKQMLFEANNLEINTLTNTLQCNQLTSIQWTNVVVMWAS